MKREGEATATAVEVEISWETVEEGFPTDTEALQRIGLAGVSGVDELVGHKTLASLAEDRFRARFFAKFEPEGLHPEVDNRFLRVRVMKSSVVPLAQVMDLETFLLASLSLLEGKILHSLPFFAFTADSTPFRVAHNELFHAGYLLGSINPSNLAVDRTSRTRGVLVGFRHVTDASPHGKPRRLPVGLIGAPIKMLQSTTVHPTYDLELESIFWCLNYIAHNYRRGILIKTLATAKWHFGQLYEMGDAKYGYLTRFMAQKESFMRFSRSLGATDSLFFDLMAKWAAGISLQSPTHPPPDYATVVSWLRAAIDSPPL